MIVITVLVLASPEYGPPSDRLDIKSLITDYPLKLIREPHVVEVNAICTLVRLYGFVTNTNQNTSLQVTIIMPGTVVQDRHVEDTVVIPVSLPPETRPLAAGLSILLVLLHNRLTYCPTRNSSILQALLSSTPARSLPIMQAPVSERVD